MAKLAKEVAAERILKYKVDIFMIAEESVHLEQVGVAQKRLDLDLLC